MAFCVYMCVCVCVYIFWPEYTSGNPSRKDVANYCITIPDTKVFFFHSLQPDCKFHQVALCQLLKQGTVAGRGLLPKGQPADAYPSCPTPCCPGPRKELQSLLMPHTGRAWGSSQVPAKNMELVEAELPLEA